MTGDRSVGCGLLRNDAAAGGEEALLVGGSSGMAAAAAIRLAHEIDDPEAVIVVLPDSGRGYLTKVFSDAWLTRYGFAPRPDQFVRVVGDVLREKSGDLPSLVHTHPNETVAEAIAIMREYSVSQMPVVRAEPPVMAAEVVGAVSERGLLDALFSHRVRPADAVARVMEESLPMLGSDRTGRRCGRAYCGAVMRCWSSTMASPSAY